MTTAKHTIEPEIELQISGSYMEADPSVGMAGGFEDIEITAAHIVVSSSKFTRDAAGKMIVSKTERRVDLTEGLDAKARDQVLANLLRGVDEEALNSELVDADIGDADAAADYRYEQMRDDRDD